MEVNLHTPLLLQQTGLRLRKNTHKSHYYMDNTSLNITPEDSFKSTKHVTFIKLPRTCWIHSFTAVCSWSGKTVYLLHVLGDGVLLQELCALACVETFRVSKELTLKVLLVHGQRGAFGEGVLLVQTQLDCRGRGGETREEIFIMLRLVTVTSFTEPHGKQSAGCLIFLQTSSLTSTDIQLFMNIRTNSGEIHLVRLDTISWLYIPGLISFYSSCRCSTWNKIFQLDFQVDQEIIRLK